VKERKVLAPYEVERPPVDPGHDERALLGEGAIDVRRREPLRARADGEPEAARVLALDGEDALRDGDRVARRRPGEHLGREPRR
jgi:hypothetical protein